MASSAITLSCRMAKLSTNFSDRPDTSFNQSSVLVRAIHFEDIRQVRFLLKKGCSPNKAVGKKKIRPLMMACYMKNGCKRITIIKSLLHHEVNPMLTDADGQNSLMYACALCLMDETKLILENTMYSFYDVDTNGNTLLHICARSSNVAVMELVLDKMLGYLMNINVCNNSDHTALDLAILNKNIECADKLREVGGQSTLPRARARTALLPKFEIGHSGVGGREEGRSGKREISTALPRTKTQACPRKASVNASLETTAIHLPSVHSNTKQEHVPIKDTEDIVHWLLELTGTRNTSTYRKPSKEMLPIDAKWVATAQASFNRTREVNTSSSNYTELFVAAYKSRHPKKKLKRRNALHHIANTIPEDACTV